MNSKKNDKFLEKIDRSQLVFAHIGEPVPENFALYAKPNQIANVRLQQKWQARRLAYFLLQQLCEQFELPPLLLHQMERTQSGRPHFPHRPDLDFNLSHSGEWVAVLLRQGQATQNAVGLDIEHPQKERNYAKLLKHYANCAELSYFGNDPTANQFYLSWCLREAVLKAQGVGIVKLSSVQHLPESQQIFCDYCPTGTLHFYANLPFYLSYFYQQNENMLSSSPLLTEWRAGQFHPISLSPSLIYQVNKCQHYPNSTLALANGSLNAFSGC